MLSRLINGKKVFDFRIISGAFSDKAKIDYSWSVKDYDSHSLSLQVDFTNPKYISMEEEPE